MAWHVRSRNGHEIMTTGLPRSRALFALAGLLCVLSATSLLLRHTPTSLEKTDLAVDLQKEKDYWHAQIVSTGGEGAYREMVKKGNNMTASQSHVLAHSFGEALFQAEGMEGFSTCGTHFIYGCYHQFIGSAIAALGIPVVEKFRAVCVSKSLPSVFPCMHGLGHGILGYLGYSPDNLKKALVLCQTPGLSDSRNGCIDGVFMEYNIHELTTYVSGKIVPREFSIESTYSPCFDVDKKYRSQCVYELPNWWVAAIAGPGDIKGRFAQAGIYCAGLNDEALIQTCSEGIGHIAPPLADLNPDVAAALCAAAAAPDYRASCLSSAVFRFKLEGFKGYSGLCERFGFFGDDLAHCRRFGNRAS